MKKNPTVKLLSPVMALLVASGAAWAQGVTAEPAVSPAPLEAPMPATRPMDGQQPMGMSQPIGGPQGTTMPAGDAPAAAVRSDPVAETGAAAGAVALPEVQSHGNVSYVTGGVTYESQPAFRDARREYPLNIELYQKSGARSEFTAGADVTVKSRAGETVLEAKADGPYLFAKVPPGTYEIEASLNGRTVKQSATVRNGGATRSMLIFPQGTD